MQDADAPSVASPSIPAVMPETLGQVRSDLEAASISAARAVAGREVWEMHSRKCRRNLQLRYKIQPEDLFAHVTACSCGWPEQKLREQQALVEAKS